MRLPLLIGGLVLAGCLPTEPGSGPAPGWPLVLHAPPRAVVLSSAATDAGELYFWGTSYGALYLPDAGEGPAQGFVIATNLEGRLRWFHTFPGRPLVDGAVGGDGTFYASSYEDTDDPSSPTASAIEALDDTGSPIWERTFSDFIAPVSVAAQGRNFFDASHQSDGGSVLERRNSQGDVTQTTSLGSGLTGPLLATGAGTYVWVDHQGLRHNDSNGALVWTLPLSMAPTQMVQLPDGNLALLGSGAGGQELDRVSPLGALLSSTPLPFLSAGAGDLAVEPDGSLFVTSVPAVTLYSVSAEGTLRWQMDGGSAAVIGSDGALYVGGAAPGEVRISRFDLDGGAG